MLKTILKGLAVIVVLLVVVVVGLLWYLDSGQYRGALEAAVASNTGYELSIAGDVELDLYPEVSLRLADVRLRNPDSPQELASTSAITLRLDRGLLFQGQLFIRELSADDLHANYYVDADGNNIWTVDSEVDSATTPDEGDDSEGADAADMVAVAFERISVRNASVDIQDLSQGSRYTIRNLNLESRDTNIEGQPFGLDLDLQLSDDGMSEPVDLNFDSTVIADLEQGNIEINDISFVVTPMLVSGQLAIANLNQAMTLSGELEAPSFDLAGLMQSLGQAEADALPGENTEPAQNASFAVSFSGDENQFTIDSLSADVAGTSIEADATIRYATDFTPTNIRYELRTGVINLAEQTAAEADDSEDPLAPDSEAEDAPTPPVAAAPVSDPTPLPTDLLTSFEMIGSTYIAALTAGDLGLQNINLLTNVEDGVLDIELLPAAAYGGTVQGSVRLDGRNPDAQFSTQLDLSQLNIADFEDAVTRLDAVTGTLNVQSSYTAEGATVEALLESLAGSTTFDISPNTVNIGLIKGVFTAIAALSPSGEAIQQWPDVIQFDQLDGAIQLENGVTENQQLNLRMDNFHVVGTGGLDLLGGNFDYQLDFTLAGPPEPQTIPVDTLYHDVSWPVACAAGFDDEVGRWCRPDFSQVREIFGQIGANALEEQLEEELTEQVPEELQDATRNLLRRILN